MPLILNVLQGPHSGQEIVVHARNSPRTVGRSPVADVPIQDEYMSDVHFAVYFDGSTARVRDLESHDGTYVNNAGTAESALKDGDQIAAGQTFFGVIVEADTDASVDEPAAVEPSLTEDITPQELHGAMKDTRLDRVRWVLRNEDHPLFAVVDLAGDPDVTEMLNDSGEEFCAFDELADPGDPGDLAPCLVALSQGSELLADLIEHTWGRGRSVYFTSESTFAEVYAHLVEHVEYAQVEGEDTPEGEENREPERKGILATSFHTPEILYETLARCGTDEAEEFFGPITAFLTESADNVDEVLRYRRSDSGVEVEPIPLTV